MNRWLRVILSGFTAFIIVGAIYIGFDNTRLQKIIAEQDKLIKNAGHKDADYLKKAKGYSDSVKNYTEKIYYLNGNQKLTSDQFIQLFNRTEHQKDSIEALLNDQRFLFKYAKEEYGFDVFLTHKKDSLTAASRLSKADSAIITYQYFKDRIKKTPSGWTVDVFGGEKDKKKLRDALKNYNNSHSQDSIKQP